MQEEINRRRLQRRARGGIGGDKGKAWRRWRAGHTVAAQHVIACAAIKRIAARSALQRVMALAPKQRVAPATAPQQIGRRIAGDRIGAAPAKGMFDNRTKGDATIAEKASNAGLAACDQADSLRRAVARQIQRIDPARVPDRQHGIKVQIEIIDRSRSGAEPIGVCTCACRQVRAIDLLEGLNIMDPERIRPQRAGPGLFGTKWAHHGELRAVLGKIGVGCIADGPRAFVKPRP